MKLVKQIPKDGVGKEKTIYGQGVRLKAKDLSTTRSTTLKITGMSSGAVQYVDIIVRNGKPTKFNKPSKTPDAGPYNYKSPIGDVSKKSDKNIKSSKSDKSGKLDKNNKSGKTDKMVSKK